MILPRIREGHKCLEVVKRSSGGQYLYLFLYSGRQVEGQSIKELCIDSEYVSPGFVYEGGWISNE